MTASLMNRQSCGLPPEQESLCIIDRKFLLPSSKVISTVCRQVMDSPFARLTELMVELVDEQKVPIPKAFMRVALGMMRRSVRKRAGFNIDDVAPLNRVSQCYIPALFGEPTIKNELSLFWGSSLCKPAGV